MKKKKQKYSRDKKFGLNVSYSEKTRAETAQTMAYSEI